MNAIGIDIGGTAGKLAGVDAAGTIEWTARSRPYDRPTTQQLVAAIREALSCHHAAAAPAAVGLCVPGILDETRTTVLRSVNVPGLNGVRLDELVTEAFESRAPRISIATDAVSTAYDLY